VKRRVLWLGVAGFLLAMLVVLPARWVGGLVPATAHCAEWRGTIWRGQCQQLRVTVTGQQPVTLEAASWKLHPLRLLRGRLAADVSITDARGDASGTIELARGELLVLHGVSARALLDPQFPGGLPAGWRGRLEMEGLGLNWQHNQLLQLQGEFNFLDLRDEQGHELGSYHASFPAAAAPPFNGQLTDLGGPLELRATLGLTVERNWSLNGTVAVRGGNEGRFTRYLEALGAPDASGRYPLSATGTFK
jgi:hypothetical protein